MLWAANRHRHRTVRRRTISEFGSAFTGGVEGPTASRETARARRAVTSPNRFRFAALSRTPV